QLNDKGDSAKRSDRDAYNGQPAQNAADEIVRFGWRCDWESLVGHGRGARFSLVEDIDRGEVPLLQELQRRPAAGGDVADFVGQAHLLDGGGAVTAADDGGGAAAGRVGAGAGDGAGALGERLFLEHAHRAIPDDRFGAFDDAGVERARLGADVNAFHLRGDVALDHLRLRVVGHAVGDDVVDGQMKFLAGLFEQIAGEIDLVALDERFADLFSLGEE